MLKFYLRVIIYFFSFCLAMFGLGALDFNKLLKQGKVLQGQILYFLLAIIIAYLFGNFLMDIIYYFN